jgi:hypothetical protein
LKELYVYMNFIKLKFEWFLNSRVRLLCFLWKQEMEIFFVKCRNKVNFWVIFVKKNNVVKVTFKQLKVSAQAVLNKINGLSMKLKYWDPYINFLSLSSFVNNFVNVFLNTLQCNYMQYVLIKVSNCWVKGCQKSDQKYLIISFTHYSRMLIWLTVYWLQWLSMQHAQILFYF